MNDNKPVKVFITYDNFLKIPDEIKQEMADNDSIEFLIYIKEEKFAQLSEEDKQKMEGFEITQTEPLRKLVCQPKEMFLKSLSPLPDIKVLEKSFKEKHRKQSKPYVPKVIGKVWSKKRGGR